MTTPTPPDPGGGANDPEPAGPNPPLRCRLRLPRGFRANDILAFHRRDPRQASERVVGRRLEKGLIWQGWPARLTVRFGPREATVALDLDGAPAIEVAVAKPMLRAQTRRMLGLEQPVTAFEQNFRNHPELGQLIERNPGLRVPLAATPFEALSWGIIGQQISLDAAIAVRRRFIQTVSRQHASGLWCYPDAHTVAGLSESHLRSAGLSAAKARSLLEVGQRTATGSLPLDEWLDDPPVDLIREQLLAIRGIGPWTVNYALLRGYGWLDGSLHGDLGVRRNLQRLLGRQQLVSEGETRQWLAGFAPWRALVAAHLWAGVSPPGSDADNS